MQGGTATAKHGVSRKRSTKRLKHTTNIFPIIIHSCLFILDFKPYSKTRTAEPSDGFLHFRETSLDTRWEVEHFRLLFIFLVAGLVDLV